MTRVSILIPTRDQGPLLPDAIAGALAQDHPDLEVVVADDASGDDTARVVQRFCRHPALRYVRNEHRLGRVANYRRALHELATGEWVLVVDGDDYLTDPGFLSRALARSAGDQETVLVVAGERVLETDGTSVERRPVRGEWERVDGAKFFLRWGISGAVVPHLASLYRRDLACRLGFYRADVLSSDWESLRRLVLHGCVLLHGRCVGVWRGHANNASRTVDVAAHVRNLESILAPGAYAIERGLDPRAVARWRDRALAEYTVELFSVCALSESLEPALALFEALRREHPVAARRAALRLVTDPKTMSLVALHGVGGRRLVGLARKLWRLLR
ncbi:MAG: glycosyltransferase family 2 protein [Candidatus Rokubacteria bacterium]|nr:glycosyltransferase family 2 protein [Candidatus Rokubacteria bacterium]